MRWKYLLPAIFGVSIPVITYETIFELHLAGATYFFLVAPIYVAITLYLINANKDIIGKKILTLFAFAGLMMPFISSFIHWFVTEEEFFDLQYEIEKVMIVFYPSSIFYVTLRNNPEIGTIMGAYAFAITANVLLYLLYGCIVYYFVKLFSKNKVPA